MRRTARIAAVEGGLLPLIRIRGRTPPPMSLADRMLHHRVPGMSVAVIEDGRIDWARGYGVLDVRSERRVTATSLFQAASISKPVTALGVLRLVERDVLDLDSDVNRWLRTWKVPRNALTEREPVTLRRILSHTAGLTVHGFPGYAIGEPVPSVVQILDGSPPANTAPVRVDIVPGGAMRYSGGGYVVLQQLLLDVTGGQFAEVTRELVLEPLGMAHSTFEQPLPSGLHPRAASGHDAEGRPLSGRWHVYPEMAAAGLWTTASDLARFAIVIERAYAARAREILGPATAREMLARQGVGLFGLGLVLEGAERRPRITHSGSNDGFRCHLVAYVHDGRGAVIMTNGDAGGALIDEVLVAIATAYAWPEFLPLERELAVVDPRLLERYVGDYSHPSIGKFAVARENDRLVVRLPGETDGRELLPESETDFFLADLDVRFRFQLEGERATSALVEARGLEFQAPRR